MTQYRHQEGAQKTDGHYPLTSGLDHLLKAKKRLRVIRLALRSISPNLEQDLSEDLEGVQFELDSILSLIETSEKNLIEAHDDPGSDS